MTVVSIVFAILLMTLTLASTQFSPRILISFVRDRTTQGTLGIFLGTFAYCMARIARRTRTPASLRTDRDRDRGDGARAGLCGMAYLLHQPHLPLDQCQPIVDRIARETELVIDEYMPYPRGPFQLPDRSEASSAEHGEPVFNR
jgi:hypothetical protein